MAERRLGWVCLAQREFEPLPVTLPDTSEAALASLARRVGAALAPGFAPPERREVLRQDEEVEVAVGEYERTSETLHGEARRGVRVTVVESCSTDAAGPSCSRVTTTVSALGMPAGTRFELSVSFRPIPFRNAGLSVTAQVAADEARLREAEAILDDVFRHGQIAE